VQLLPCAALAFISHPKTRHQLVFRILWAFCVYVEAVSVAPQVVLMQQNKTVEKFTGHYVFFLGVSRFFSCAHWILQMFDSRGSQLWTVCPLVSHFAAMHSRWSLPRLQCNCCEQKCRLPFCKPCIANIGDVGYACSWFDCFVLTW
jgi:hypothetical protein